MLEVIAIVFFMFWLLGVTSSYIAGGLVHILLIISIATGLISFIKNRRV